jgi:hypothetical protein
LAELPPKRPPRIEAPPDISAAVAGISNLLGYNKMGGNIATGFIERV